MSDIGNSYFNGHLGHFPSLQGTKVAEYFRLHAAGSIVEAFELSRLIDYETITDKKVRELFKADRLLLAMKVGQNILAELEAAVVDDRDARCVLEYTRYSYFFWNDHKKAWRAIAKLALIAPLSSHRLLILNLIFLVGHTAAIGGHRWFGYSLARVAFRFAVRLRRRGKAPFVTNLIVASFPYTLFVTTRLNGLQDTLDLIMPMLPADNYYQSIFQASALYAHSYSGNITQSEMFASKFRKLHSTRLIHKAAGKNG